MIQRNEEQMRALDVMMSGISNRAVAPEIPKIGDITPKEKVLSNPHLIG